MVVIGHRLVNRPAALTQKRLFDYDCRKGRGRASGYVADRAAGLGRP
jgi:hypothetical protein